MVKATILSLEQTDAAGLFTIVFEGESQSEFVKLDGLLKSDIERGVVRIERTQIIGVDGVKYDI